MYHQDRAPLVKALDVLEGEKQIVFFLLFGHRPSRATWDSPRA
jgi:hypothetical protein